MVIMSLLGSSCATKYNYVQLFVIVVLLLNQQCFLSKKMLKLTENKSVKVYEPNWSMSLVLILV